MRSLTLSSRLTKSCSARAYSANPARGTRRNQQKPAQNGGGKASMAMAGVSPFSLEGQTILIAGGASGIGASAAAICAGLGAKLVLADVSDATPVAEKLRREGHQASAASCDVT